MFKTNKSKSYVSINSSHKEFTFCPDGITVVPRASLKISQRCPENYKDLILECVNHGWLQPVANMRDTEYTMELLRK
jgi:hypothetical protein